MLFRAQGRDRTALLALAPLALIGCSESSQRQTKDEFSLIDLHGPLLPQGTEEHCLEGRFVMQLRPGGVGPVTVCFGTAADTFAYVYSLPQGAIISVTREYSVAPQRLVPVADSLTASISARFGPPEPCDMSILGEFIERHLVWHGRRTTL